MSNLLPALLALALATTLAPAPVFAEKQYKQTCQEFCAKQCEMSSYGKNMCIPSCNAKCNQKRSEKK